MKKFFVILTALLLVVVLSACNNKKNTGKFDVADGKYFAAGEFEEGYRYYVVVTVDNKKITNLEWNGYSIDGGAGKCKGENKLTCAADGKYGMNNPAEGTTTDKGKGTWDDQAKAAAQWIVDNQKLDVTFTEGKTDAISSVTVSTETLFNLVKEALDHPAVAHGSYAKDGYYYVESTKTQATSITYAAQKEDGTALDNIVTGTYDSYTFGTFVIVNGTLVLADFNATYPLYQFKTDANGAFVLNNTTDKYKIVLCGADGKPLQTFKTKDAAKENYGMRAAGGEWYTQAQKVEAKLLADQSLNITVTEGSGKVDGLTSVSFGHSVASMKEILDKLNTQAK